MKKGLSKLAILSAIAVMILIDSSGPFTYAQRSILKLTLFGLIPFLSLKKNRKVYPNLKKDKHFKIILMVSLLVILGVFVGAYILNTFDALALVKKSLSQHVGVNANNYPYVFIYIVLINGPQEEFFFRYFIYEGKHRFLSSFLFSIYHVGMLFPMLPWYVFLMAVLGLMVVGYFFIALNGDDNSILNSIIVHMAANVAINIIGWLIIMR